MLGVSKEVIINELRQKALDLQQQELTIYVNRYTNMATIAAISAGFTLHSMAVLNVPEEIEHRYQLDSGLVWLEFLYFLTATIAFCCSVHITAVSSFAVVYASWIALLGGTGGSLTTALSVLKGQHTQIWCFAALGMFCVAISATSLMWLKLHEAIAATTSAIFAACFLSLALRTKDLNKKLKKLQPEKTPGYVHLNVLGGTINLGRLHVAREGEHEFVEIEASIKRAVGLDHDHALNEREIEQ